MGAAPLLGHLIPLLPFFFLTTRVFDATVSAVILSGITLFLIGWYEARTTVGSVLTSGIRMVFIGLGSGFAGFAIGFAIEHLHL